MEIRIKTGLAGSSVSRWLEVLRNEGLVYINHWQDHPSGGRFVGYYMKGSFPDAKKPEVRTDAQRMADVHARRRIPPPHPLMALFG